MNKTSQSIGLTRTFQQTASSSMSRTKYKPNEDKLAEAFAEIKIENIAHKLKERGIVKIEHLIGLSEEELDGWKDVPVGYRIKIR
ncbi:unnamed protein product, partial [Sphagnum balticum]